MFSPYPGDPNRKEVVGRETVKALDSSAIARWMLVTIRAVAPFWYSLVRPRKPLPRGQSPRLSNPL